MTENDYHLDSMVCFAIYSASNAVAKAHRVALEPWGLTYTQYIVLLETSTSGAGLSIRDLGSRMSLDSGTLSPLLRRLEQRQLVLRQRSSEDERVVTVTLTSEGRTMLKDVLTALQGLRAAYGFESAAQARDLIHQLHRITEGMRQLSTSPSKNSTHLEGIS
ncbi:DNA-binding transcriptional regulator, MarR family [Arthrobacter alpinus]|uniref:DNA-binding transcriptional regulator, MarR family n=1 Tax=Arthrobacter alpinus TaxID=656366 RepID=A0A1H5IJB5_9MICC|nr:MarR family transcriptional regulator [Arthrobacter alpinus]SEE40247.1 DNA-binding transcriptional regulator, MarR family [Arthrobacter alpinus]